MGIETVESRTLRSTPREKWRFNCYRHRRDFLGKEQLRNRLKSNASNASSNPTDNTNFHITHTLLRKKKDAVQLKNPYRHRHRWHSFQYLAGPSVGCRVNKITDRNCTIMHMWASFFSKHNSIGYCHTSSLSDWFSSIFCRCVYHWIQQKIFAFR